MAGLLRLERGVRQRTAYYHFNDGYYYHLNRERESADGTKRMYLRCIYHGTLQRCRGAAVAVDTGAERVRVDEQPHTCARDRFLPMERQLRHDVLDEIRNNRDIFQRPVFVMTRVRARYPPHVAARVTANRMRSAIRRAADPLHLPRIPQSIEELARLMGEHHNITATMDEADNTFLGMVGPAGHRSLIFMSRRVAAMICREDMRDRVQIVFSDGTFASRPSRPRFMQVFQISLSIDNHVVPFCQVLMQTRRRVAYIPVLEAIRLACPNFQPRLAVTDFEPAMMQAWVHVYHIEVQGCFWHFSRAVTIQSRTMGLTIFFNQHDRARSIFRSLLALPLLPSDLIGEGFMSLAYEAADEGVYAMLHSFFLKIHDTWLTGFRFEMLSVFLAEHRTNNVSESANRMLRLRTHVHRPNISLFLDAIRSMETNAYLDLITLSRYQNPGRARKTSAVNNDIFIINYSTDLLAGRITPNRFLHLASTRMFNVFRQFLGE